MGYRKNSAEEATFSTKENATMNANKYEMENGEGTCWPSYISVTMQCKFDKYDVAPYMYSDRFDCAACEYTLRLALLCPLPYVWAGIGRHPTGLVSRMLRYTHYLWIISLRSTDRSLWCICTLHMSRCIKLAIHFSLDHGGGTWCAFKDMAIYCYVDRTYTTAHVGSVVYEQHLHAGWSGGAL